MIHISASDPRASPWLSSTVQLLIAESAAQSPGGTVVVSRLVDVLLIQVLRTFVTSSPSNGHGLCALADPQIGPGVAADSRPPRRGLDRRRPGRRRWACRARASPRASISWWASRPSSTWRAGA